MSKPVPHSFVCNDVIISVFYFVFLHNLENLSCEPTFRVRRSSFSKDDYWTTLNNILNFRMPNLHIILELFFVFFWNFAQSIKKASNIIFFISKQNFFVTLSEKDCRSLFDIELFKSFRRSLSAKAIILDIVILTKNWDWIFDIL